MPSFQKRRRGTSVNGCEVVFFLFDNSARNSDTPDALLSMMEFAHRRHGCTVFALDNLMSMRLPDGKDFTAHKANL